MPFYVKAQELLSNHLNNQKGLPTNTIYDITQDLKGFIWMAGNEGLFRYDGVSYISYGSPQQTSKAGSNIKTDKYGRVWYENFDGFLYYVENDSLKNFKQNPPVDYIPFGITDKYLFVAQKKGIDIYDIKTLMHKKTVVAPIDIPEHATILGTSYYFIADDIIYKIDSTLSLTSSKYFSNKKLKVKYIYPYVNSLYIISKNNEQKKLFFFDEQLNFKDAIAIPHINYIQGSDVVDNNIFLYSSRGMAVYTKNGKILFEKQELFSKQSISSVIKDYQNNYWISTTDNGVFIAPELQTPVYNTTGYLPLRIEKNQSGYLLGTRTGELLQLNEDFKVQKKISGNSDNLPVYYINCNKENKNIIFSAKGFSFIPGSNSTLEKKYNIALKQAVQLDEKYIAYAASGFCALYLNPNANKNKPSIWDNLYNKNTLEALPYTARIIKGLRAKSVDYNELKQQIVFATNIGLYTVSPNETKELLYESKSFYAEQVACINNEIFTLDTKGDLYKIKDGKEFELLNDKLGIPRFSIKKIKVYDKQIIILNSQRIYAYTPETQSASQIQLNTPVNNIKDILKNNEHIIAITNNGIMKIPLSEQQTNIQPRFYINTLYVNSEKQKWKHLGKLNHSENNITIHFSLLEFTSNNTMLYYRINNNSWIQISSTTNNLRFPSLSPGKYVIEFKINETISSENINFEITTPFWRAWWFYSICSLGIGILVFSYFKRQAALMKKQITLLNEKVILEKNLSKSVLTSIKSQMNPHFFYNALNTIQAYIFTNDRIKANTYLAKFSKLTRIVLEMSEKESTSLHEEIEALTLYLELEKMRFKDSFQYTISTDEVYNKAEIELPPMLIQPYVENAIKHGLLHREEDRKLHILFIQKNGHLYVTISDNGIGRKRSAELNKIKTEKHQPFSTKATEKRLALLNKTSKNKTTINIIDQYDINGNPTGTTVELIIPID